MVPDESNSSSRYWLCPLYSFDCDCESIDLAEGIQIKPAPRELKKHIGERSRDLYGRLDDPSKFDWAAFLPHPTNANGVRAPVELARIGYRENDRARDLLIDLVTALRLCHQGMVTPGPLRIRSITIWTPISQSDSLHQEPKYTLHQSDVPQVNELVNNFGELRKLGKLDSIGIALRRFNSSYHGSLEDRLIDQMIAFESLYLGYDQELKYRLALRAAFLLGKDDGERKDIFNKIRKAYSFRSDIVHGNKQLEWSELKEVISETEGYLRQSIQSFLLLLSKGHSLKNLRQGTDNELAKLDENILSNGRLLSPNSSGKE